MWSGGKVMDEEILNQLAHFRESLQAITQDFQKIKDTAYQLYKEKEDLLLENEHLRKLLFAKEEAKEKETQPQVGAGLKNLARLYEEGFHVCHINFAEKRRGDCLFCQKLLESSERQE